MNAARHVLNANELALLHTYGSVEDVSEETVLFAAGDNVYDLIVILEGRARIAEQGRRQRIIGTFERAEFLGEFDLLTGRRVFLTATMLTSGRILRVPLAELRELMSRERELSEVILRTLLARRANLMELGAGLTLIGARDDRATRRLLEALTRNRLASAWLDPATDSEARAMLTALDVPDEDLPIILVPGAEPLRNPTMAQLRETLGLEGFDDGGPSDRCDLLVIGGGPGGLAAAVYGASEGLSTILVEDTALGGQAGTSSLIENYLGFPAGLSGAELTARAVLQARKFDARIKLGTKAISLTSRGGLHGVAFDDRQSIVARTVVIASGARYRRLPLAGLEELEGVGVYYAATGMEARACAGGPVGVVGGGNSAGQAALYLARSCTHVDLVVRADDLAVTMSQYLIDAIRREPRIAVTTRSEVTRLVPGDGLEAIEITDADGVVRGIPVCGLFVFIGVTPSTSWLDGQLARDSRGFLLTGSDIPVSERDPSVPAPLPVETSRPGVFCIGDARSGSIKRVATAIGEGSMAVRMAFERFAGSGGPEV